MFIVSVHDLNQSRKSSLNKSRYNILVHVYLHIFVFSYFAEMQALHWDASRGSVKLITIEKPQISKPDQLLIKVAYSGVCGTDLHVMKQEFPAAEKVVMGHEFTGTVENIGGEVTGFKIGDNVAVDPNSSCMKCAFCLKGQPNYCPTGGGRSGIGMFRNGGWAEYCVVPQAQVFSVPAELSLATGALCEPMSCLQRGWDMIQPLLDDAKILITGAGMIGLLWSSLLHHKGYRNITISEPTDGRRKLAENLGLGLKVLTPDALAAEYKEVDSDSWF
ncbi:unnamed protein product [Owenia fusiformis]|uniref:Alcohol dehydrogenase-like N-terminal domain-containing protein n=1 Tax=Owenia fusiformis TaxID=6347 RepID=A0A8S4PPE1_OWEFU|nr:unnamed protein product [Owenia fusiformis]